MCCILSHSSQNTSPVMLKTFGSSLVVGLFVGLSALLPAKAAEDLVFTYGSLKLNLPVASLKTFAQTGKVDDKLAPYANMIGSKDLEEFRNLLTKKIPIDPVRTSRFLNSAMGEQFLYRMGKAINIEGRINGKYALRGAIVQSAFQPGGFTLLGFLEKYPTNLEFPGEFILSLSQRLSNAIEGTELFVAKMRQWTIEEAKTNIIPIDFEKSGDLERSGNFEVKEETWHLEDTKRNRKFYVLVFRPTTYRQGSTPVVLVSHGLASRPEDFAKRAKHLATYGFVVALPQHPGSDLQYLEDMFAGLHRNIFDVDEFINRPLDISFLIDELERRNQSQFEGKLNLKRVGVVGHSFGGYTALAVVGAKINFDYLDHECNRSQYAFLNTALILQCRALELPHKDYNFRDERVVAVMAVNPVNRAMFGKEGIAKINVPVLLGSGSYDPATPPIFEQVSSFVALNSPDKYLLLAEGQAHVDFSVLDGGITSSVQSIGDVQLPNPNKLHVYFDSMVLAFTEVHVAQNADYIPYLTSAYALYLSKGNDFKLSFIDEKFSPIVEKEVRNFLQKHSIRD